MQGLEGIVGKANALLGMVHVGALPGTPRAQEPVAVLAERAAQEAELLRAAGFDSVVVENMHDTPYLAREVGPEIVASMATVTRAVVAACDLPVGVQILAGANRAALAVALAAGASFVRAEGFVFASIADEGFLDRADAGPLLRYRRQIGADHVKILADIKKKHSSHAVTSDVGLDETARAAEFFGADGVVVTGTSTGAPTSIQDLDSVGTATTLPVVVGSGATPESIGDLFRVADGVIVGSWYKRDGLWSNAPDPDRARQLVDAANRARDGAGC